MGSNKKETSKVKKEAKVECNDRKCALHGSIKTRGRTFTGIVISDKMQNTVRVEWLRLVPITKYERFEKRRSRVKAHNPPCINAKINDRVKIIECRPISKTVKFMVVEVLK